jgi:hypothetical protein
MFTLKVIQCVECLTETEMLHLSYESDNVAVLPTAVAVESACCRIDRERGIPFLVERTESYVKSDLHGRPARFLADRLLALARK